jgi:hypothetical protein
MSIADELNRLNKDNHELREEIRHLHRIMGVQGRVSMGLMKVLLDEVADRKRRFVTNEIEEGESDA